MPHSVYYRAAKLGRPLLVKIIDYRGCTIDQKTDGFFYYNIPGHHRLEKVGYTFDTLKRMEDYLYHLYQYHRLDEAIARLDKPLTKSQAKCLDWMHCRILEQDSISPKFLGRYEYKQIDLQHGCNVNHLFYYTVVGSKDDEGTAAAVLCRSYRQLVVGPRGGLRSLIGPKSKSTGVSNILIWGKN